MKFEQRAPAKVNLFLHVGPPRADGFHDICSLMVFADIGDRVSLSWGEGNGLSLTGGFSGALSAGEDNLIIKARDALLQGASEAHEPFCLMLDKQLPIASGLGGGSADAAATLRLLRDALQLGLNDDQLGEIARPLGSDVPACVNSRATIATGRGERLQEAPPFPDLPAVLVNPCLPSPTGAVYRAYDQNVSIEGANEAAWPTGLDNVEAMAVFLAGCRNDLQAPAVGIQPAIGDVLALLGGQDEALLTRMSGSGATCFALCRSSADAARLATRLVELRPDWWIRACTLQGSRT